MHNQHGYYPGTTVIAACPPLAPPSPSRPAPEPQAGERTGEVWSAFFVNCALHADRIAAMRQLREETVARSFAAVRRDDAAALEKELVSFEMNFPDHNIPLVEQRPCSGARGQSPRGEKHLNQGRTLLHYAAMLDKVEPAQVLLNHCADVDATDAFGNTPLHLAIRAGKTCQVVSLLLGGASAVDAVNSRGDTPISLARRYGSKEMRALVREYMPYSPQSEDDEESDEEDAVVEGMRIFSFKGAFENDEGHETDNTATFSDCHDTDSFSDCLSDCDNND